jgi:hypothetical protein
MEGVKTWLSSMVADFFDMGMQKLIPPYDKCLNSGGDYVDKYHKYFYFLYLFKFFSHCIFFLTAHWRLLSEYPS